MGQTLAGEEVQVTLSADSKVEEPNAHEKISVSREDNSASLLQICCVRQRKVTRAVDMKDQAGVICFGFVAGICTRTSCRLICLSVWRGFAQTSMKKVLVLSKCSSGQAPIVFLLDSFHHMADCCFTLFLQLLIIAPPGYTRPHSPLLARPCPPALLPTCQRSAFWSLEVWICVFVMFRFLNSHNSM